MRLAVLGAGSVGPAAAVLAVSRGHQAVLWSPRGGGTHGIGTTLRAEGLVAGTAKVEVAVDVGRALERAEAVMVSVPPHALGPVLRRIAPLMRPGVPVLLAPSHSLAPLLLDRLAAAYGVAAPIGALAQPPVAALRTGPASVRILALPEQVELAAVPAGQSEPLARLAAALFGVAFLPLGDALGAALAAAEPVRQAALAIANVTRIEAAEDWDTHLRTTPAVCRVMEALDAERLALAAAYGHPAPSLAAQLHRASGVPEGRLTEMAAALAELQGPSPGPKGLDAAHLAESVTYGLALWLRLAAPKGVDMPLTRAAVALLEAMWGHDLGGDDLLEGLDLGQLPRLLAEGHPR